MEKSVSKQVREAVQRSIDLREGAKATCSVEDIAQDVVDQNPKLISSYGEELALAQIRAIAGNAFSEARASLSEQLALPGDFGEPEQWLSLPGKIWKPFRAASVADWHKHTESVGENAKAVMLNYERKKNLDRFFRRHASNDKELLMDVLKRVAKKDPKTVEQQLQMAFG